jgi:DNA polymerase III delta prime subunit
MTSTNLLAQNLFDPALANRQVLVTSFLSAAVLKGRLTHAYLFTGRAMLDGMQIVNELASHLNCTRKKVLPNQQKSFEPDTLSCLRYFSGRELEKAQPLYCQNCRWIFANQHPQALVRLDSADSKSSKIAVEKARSLNFELTKESSFFRVVLIDNASQEVFHRPAANAILKTIESPRTPCVFCLFAVRQEEVLPTVVSRCQVLPLSTTENQAISLTANRSGNLLNLAMNSLDSEESTKPYENMKALMQSLKQTSKTAGLLTWLEAAKELSDLSADLDCSWVIDTLVEDELAKQGKIAITNSRVAKYLYDLTLLAETTKLQITQYVATKSSLESFCLSWWQLKNNAQLW